MTTINLSDPDNLKLNMDSSSSANTGSTINIIKLINKIGIREKYL
jgi:hypothetical protein